MIGQLKSILKYDLIGFFRYKTNLIWLLATPIVFSLTGAFLSLLLGKDRLMEAIGGQGSGTLYVLVGYLIFSFANYGWQINNKIEREMSLGTLQYNFLLPYKKQLYIYGLCLGTIFSNGIFSGILLIIIFVVKGGSITSILRSLLLLLLVLIIYLGISLIISSFTLIVKKIGSLTNIITFSLQMLTGMIIPLRIFPKSARYVLQSLPTSLAIDAVRSSALNLEPLYDFKWQIILLAIYGLILNIFGFFLVTRAIEKSKLLGNLEAY